MIVNQTEHQSCYACHRMLQALSEPEEITDECKVSFADANSPSKQSIKWSFKMQRLYCHNCGVIIHALVAKKS